MDNLVKDYLSKLDWRVRENSNASFSYQGLNQHVATSVVSQYWLNDVYSESVSSAHINGAMHIHDLGMLTAYCCGWDLYDLLSRGFGGVYGKVQASPPKHFSSALGQLVNFMYTMAGELAGAVAVSNFDTLLAPFVRYDNLSYGQVKQFIQEFVYNMNAPTRLGFQSVFSNLTMDLTPSPNYVNECVVIGGELQNQTYGEFQPEMDLINKAFCEVMLEGDAKGRVFTFPIPTYNLHKEFDWENQELLWKMTGKYGVPYFANFINSDLKPEDTRSMCPLSGNTKVVVRSKQNGVRVAEIREIINNINNKGTVYEVFTKEGWHKCRPVIVEKTDIYRITFSNGSFVDMGENHLQPTKDNGIIKAKEIKENMWIPFNKNVFGGELGDYNLGYVVGAYLGDGSHDKNRIVYSLCADEKDDITEEKLSIYWKKLGFFVKKSTVDSVRFLYVSSGAYDIIKRFITGSSALDKDLSRIVFNTSYEFRIGLLEGYADTDGSKEKKRLYTSSKNVREGFSFLLSSLGMKYNISTEDCREDRYGNNPVYRIDYPSRSSYGNFYKEDEYYHYYRVVSVEKIPSSMSTNLYCFEVDNESHTFVLANGLVTHNCRLRLNRKQLAKRAGGLFAASALTGSVGVVTINMPRIGYKAKSVNEFYSLLNEVMELAKESLEVKRCVIEELTEKGLYPYSTHYLDGVYAAHKKYWYNHFSTIGLVGMNEACLNLLGVGIDTNEGKHFSESVLKFMLDKLSEYQNDTGNLYNLEASPCESATFRMAKCDKKLYPDIIAAGTNEIPFYTNSTQLPVDTEFDVIDVLDHQNSLQRVYTGGTVVHLLLGESANDWRTVRDFVRMVATQYEIPYFTLTPTFSVCKNHGYISGEVYNCPQCNEPTEVYSRVVGYLRPVQNWNDAKQLEFKKRSTYKL